MTTNFKSSAEVKNTWSYTSTPPYDFMAWYLVKHRKILQSVEINSGKVKP
jgi:hypothetical protein